MTAWYQQFAVDGPRHDQSGISELFDAPAESEWGSISTWAAGYSLLCDFVLQDESLDENKCIFVGHSRLGKAALWAAALFRGSRGEKIFSITAAYPYWFREDFREFSGGEDELPFDQHMLIGLIAPRPVVLSVAEGDWWCNPRNEYLSAIAATPIYNGLGFEGYIDAPNQTQSTPGRIGFYAREGFHELESDDWRRILEFSDYHLQ